MVKDHSDSEKGNPLPPHGLLFSIDSKGSFICTSHRQDNTYHGLCYTSHGALAGTRNSSMGILMETFQNLLPMKYVYSNKSLQTTNNYTLNKFSDFTVCVYCVFRVVQTFVVNQILLYYCTCLYFRWYEVIGRSVSGTSNIKTRSYSGQRSLISNKYKLRNN